MSGDSAGIHALPLDTSAASRSHTFCVFSWAFSLSFSDSFLLLLFYITAPDASFALTVFFRLCNDKVLAKVVNSPGNRN
jgi:hypothetical protein